MRIRKPWLRVLAWTGATMAACLLLLLGVCWAILSRKPLSPEFMRQSENIAGDESEAVAVQFDPENPPQSHRDNVEASLKRAPNEGDRLYLELLREFETGNYYEQWESVTDGYMASRTEDQLSSEALSWREAHHDFIERIKAMIEAGGPPIDSTRILVALRREVIKTHAERQFIMLCRDLLIEEVKMAIADRSLNEAIEATKVLLRYVKRIQHDPGYINNIIVMLMAGMPGELWKPVLQERRLDAPSARKLLSAYAGVRPFHENFANALDLQYQLRRVHYIDALNASPVEAFWRVEAIQRYQLGSVLHEQGLGAKEDDGWMMKEMKNFAFSAKYVSTNLRDVLRIKIQGERSIDAMDEYWRRCIEVLDDDFLKSDAIGIPSPPGSMLSTEPVLAEGFIKHNWDRSANWVGVVLFQAALRELADTSDAKPLLDPFTGLPFRRRVDGDFVEYISPGPDAADDEDDYKIRFRMTESAE